MDNCSTCAKNIRAHAKHIKCTLCAAIFHIKCITLNYKEQKGMINNKAIWNCLQCNIDLFPYNHIESNKEFVAAAKDFNIYDRISTLPDNLIFEPFEINNDDYYSPLVEIDPEIKKVLDNSKFISSK